MIQIWILIVVCVNSVTILLRNSQLQSLAVAEGFSIPGTSAEAARKYCLCLHQVILTSLRLKNFPELALS